MTITQATGARHVSRRAQVQRERRWEEIKTIAVIVFLMLAFMFAGTLDYQDEQREMEYWHNQGITVTRDW